MKLLHFKPPVPNFGDDLNAMLWPALAPALFRGEHANAQDVRSEDAFVGIGTIVGIDAGTSRKLHVFSSGIGYTGSARWRDLTVTYHCVRGPVTARVLGLPADRVLTDGAILAPLVEGLHPRLERRGGTVVVPHYETIAFPGWAEAMGMAGFELVDPRGAPEAVIASLAAADLVLTESLHGAILADAFGVPWRGFAVSRNFSTAKWADWAASLDLVVDVAMVPPPDAIQLFRHGSRPEPFGSMVRLDPETALGEFRRRMAPSRTPILKVGAKRVLEVLPAARRLLGFSAERTAEAMTRLAAMEPQLSSQHRRDMLREEMLGRLDRLVRAYGEQPVMA